jgi:hypothetical protein
LTFTQSIRRQLLRKVHSSARNGLIVHNVLFVSMLSLKTVSGPNSINKSTPTYQEHRSQFQDDGKELFFRYN